MAFKVLSFCVFLVAMIRQEQKCQETVLHSGTSAMEFVIAHWFPQDIEINESCVAEGCPTLKSFSLCSGELDLEMLRDIIGIMNDCMKRPICGMDVDARPLTSLVASMEEFLPAVEINGTATIPPDNGYLTNISNIQLEAPATEIQHLNPLIVTVSIPNLRMVGRVQFDFRVETVLGLALTASLTQSTYDVGLQFISTVVVNKTTTGPAFDVRFINSIVRSRPLFCGFDMPAGFPDILSLFTSTAQMVIERSTMAKRLGEFLERFYRSAFLVVSNNCGLVNATV